MPSRKNTPFNITLIGTLLALTIFSEHEGAYLLSDFTDKIMCHFHHGNLFHWLCNAFALWLMRPSPKMIACSFIIAVGTMFFTITPTLGFSAVIYAYIGMNIIRWKVSIFDWISFIVANLITAFIPNVAFGVHLAAFLLGMGTYIIYSQINRIVLAVESK